ncbi:hypothetical protein CspeluHIS016_0300920 [Cutaneotrichosporon spelunceum]|uniref:Secreted protein n=1 Tax=Cutaneotrichosporon spelunceum TaxID=1672016 RepID=A0AAD3TSV7_9TREE|nr:hypothetical protein CspeluHIS016_0300920 [Cutaneotrichosporon spelunceum]
MPTYHIPTLVIAFSAVSLASLDSQNSPQNHRRRRTGTMTGAITGPATTGATMTARRRLNGQKNMGRRTTTGRTWTGRA